MRPLLVGICCLFFGLLAVPFEADAAKGKKTAPSTLKSLSEQTYKVLASVFAVRATQLGWHGHDMHLNDYSPKGLSMAQSSLTSLRSRIASLAADGMTAEERIDQQLLLAQVDRAIFNLKEIGWHRRLPQLYLRECYDGIAQLMYGSSDASHLPVSDIIARITAIPLHLELSRRAIRTAPSVSLLHALELCNDVTQLLSGVSAELSRKVPGRAREMDRVTARAIQAIADHRSALNAMTTASDQQVAIGETAFSSIIRNTCFVTANLDSLEALAADLLAEAQGEYSNYLSFVEESRQFGQDSVFVPTSFSRDDLLEYYEWEVEQVRSFLEGSDVVSVPFDDGFSLVRQSAPALGGKLAEPRYFSPGPFSLEQGGYLAIRALPDTLDEEQLGARYRFVHRRGFRTTVVRELFPGRHLLSLAGAGVDNPIRRWENSPMLLGGWPLYCEAVCYEAGLYGSENPVQWLTILDTRRWAFVGMLAEIRLHRGGTTPADLTDWIRRALATESMAADRQITDVLRRSIAEPGMQTAAVLGLLELERLRDMHLASSTEEEPTDREFHDWLLRQGLIAPSLLQWPTANQIADTPDASSSN